MVVHKNSEKMLAEILGSKDDLTVIYYQHSKRFQYQGRINARSIIESVTYIMSFKDKEVPLEALNTKEQLETFLKSTDEAIILLEFCDWSARILPKDSESRDFLGENITIDDEILQFGENGKLKESDNGNRFCSVENEHMQTTWLEGISWPTENASLGLAKHTEWDGNGLFDCSRSRFKQFDSFFWNFTKVMRESLLPPEKFRFGHISEPSLLPLMGVEIPKSWTLLHWISGCPNCLEIFQEGDDLRNFVQLDRSLIVDLDGDESTYDDLFPANQPSIILFIDRRSDLSNINQESKNVLDAFRRFAYENLSDQKFRKQTDANKGSSMVDTSQVFSKRVADNHLPLTDLLSSHRILKVGDQVAFIVVDKSGRISQERDPTEHDSIPSNFLAQVLQQKILASGKTKFSLIAKEAGFQLISDDFEIKVSDSNLQQNAMGQFESEMKSNIFPLEDDSGFHLDPVTGHPTIFDSSSSEAEAIGKGKDDIQWSKDKTDITVSSIDVSTDNMREKNDDLYIIQPGGSSDKGNTLSTSEDHSLTLEKSLHEKDGNLNEPRTHVDGMSSNGGLTLGVYPETKLQMGSIKMGMLAKKHVPEFQFAGSCFVSDGGYRMLQTLTGDIKLPSMVIIDPALQQHYVLSFSTNFSYTYVVGFVNDFLKGKLSPHQRSQQSLSKPRQFPRPPFVNLDFHETDAIPRVSMETFAELVLGCSRSDKETKIPYFKEHCGTGISNRDVIVLFTHSWCGFCLRMELIVREVYRAFQGLTSMLKSQRTKGHLKWNQDNINDSSSNMVPSFFYMDCSLNDCSFFLDSLPKRDFYPTVVLFPAGKDSVSYDGDMSVNGIFEFIEAYASTSRSLINGYKDILWTQKPKARVPHETTHTPSIALSTAVVGENKFHESSVGNPSSSEEHHHLDAQLLDRSHTRKPSVAVGSILAATNKLANAYPFDNSSILIVKADKNAGFQGVILNKRMNWNVFVDMDGTLSALKEAPLSYGGPVKMLNMPLVSLTQRTIRGYSEVFPGVYFGDPVATSLAIDGIRSGIQSAVDLWFFLGFSGWDWDQLFVEIARGDWDLGKAPPSDLVWPEV